MTRREWAELAAVISEELAEWQLVAAYNNDPRATGAVAAIACVATKLAYALKRHHARFDVQRFLQECGL